MSEQIKASFEKWHQEKFPFESLEKFASGLYKNESVFYCFEGYKAALAAQAQQPVELSSVPPKLPIQAQQEPALQVTDAMAFAFHHALTDGDLGESDMEEIKVGLRAALIAQPVQQDRLIELIVTHGICIEYTHDQMAVTAYLCSNPDIHFTQHNNGNLAAATAKCVMTVADAQEWLYGKDALTQAMTTGFISKPAQQDQCRTPWSSREIEANERLQRDFEKMMREKFPFFSLKTHPVQLKDGFAEYQNGDAERFFAGYTEGRKTTTAQPQQETPKQVWISVNDGLPEMAEKVLGIYDNGMCSAFMRIQSEDGHWCWAIGRHDLYDDCFYDADDDYQVTHWMPLPPFETKGEQA